MAETKLLLPEKTADLTPIQKGWIRLSQMKEEATTDLQKMELEVQGMVNGYEDQKLDEIQTNLRKAKGKAADLKARRLAFTNLIQEKLTVPMMSFEKRTEELLGKVSEKELEKRKKANEEEEARKAKSSELARLVAHVTNQYLELQKNYRQELEKLCLRIYSQALNERINAKSIDVYIGENLGILSAIKPGIPQKFDRKLVSIEEAHEAVKNIQKPEYKKIFEEVIERMRTQTFGMYEQDLKNAEKAIEAAEQQFEEEVAAENEEFVMESSTNNLMSSAETFELISPNAGKTEIKKKMVIVREDTEEFAQKILSTFIKNWPAAKTKLGTKSWIKLVDPFVKALDKMEKEFPGLKTEEVIK